MNLIEDRWIPVRRQNGDEEKIAPWELTSNFEHNPIVSLAAPRPDFQGGLMQFLIGLVQTAAPPDEDNDLEWEDWFEEPPEPETLQAKFDAFVDCFHLDGDGPRFMQDLELESEGTPQKPISALLIDAPGEKTIKDNTDHFIKRDGVHGMCSSCAATALFTFQTNAPSGGQGHRTSLRGGGPLTTLIVLDPRGSEIEIETLWHNIWLNILDKRTIKSEWHIEVEQLHRIFPWFAPTRTSEKGTRTFTTTPEDVDLLQMYWGMPRRIRLDFDHTNGVCDICDNKTLCLVKQYVTKNYGINYSEEWQHHLSPHRINNDGKPLPHHPQPGGFAYKYWIGLSEGSEADRPAKVVTEFSNRKLDSEQFRLWIFGYDMDNMKPRCWYETTFPLYLFSDIDKGNVFSVRVNKIIEASKKVVQDVEKCIKEALGIKGSLGHITESFYTGTEREFFEALKNLYDMIRENSDGLDILAHWYEVIKEKGMQLFEDYTLREDIAFANMKRVVQARKKLRTYLNGRPLRQILQIPQS